MTKQHRERDTARCTKTEKQGTRFHASEARVQQWSGQGTGQKPWSKHQSRGRPDQQHRKKEQTSVCEATLTDELNTQLKDQKQARLINVLMFSTRITKIWRCFVNRAASSHSPSQFGLTLTMANTLLFLFVISSEHSALDTACGASMSLILRLSLTTYDRYAKERSPI